MGYGFVEFKTAAMAQKALRHLQNSRLDDHVLQLKLSSRQSASAGPKRQAKGGKEDDAKGGKGKPTSTIMVRNMPFEANKKEVKELFAAFGQLKTVRPLSRGSQASNGPLLAVT